MTRAANGTRLVYGEITRSRKPEFLAAGFAGRHFFPHHVCHLPKCGPDGYRLAQRMCSEQQPDAQSELVLYAAPELARQFPAELWFDDDLIWHQQHFGRTGQVATANLRVKGRDLYSMVLVSDLVQRISRRPREKSRIENRFKGWPRMLLNALLAYAAENGFLNLYVPRSAWALRHTDPRRTVGPALFERIYDRPPELYAAEAAGDWWRIDVAANRDRVIVPELRNEPLPDEKVICICHDVEEGLGHVDCDPAYARVADEAAAAALAKMARVEQSAGIRATYNVVGCLFDRVEPVVSAHGHELAFHSYNHVLKEEQLAACRKVDYRLKGYRPPQSRLTGELSDAALCFHNFEWLASSVRSLGCDQPRLENRLVKIPIQFDDWPMYAQGVDYGLWREKAVAAVRSADFIAFSLHDCYAQFWLSDYARLLEEIQSLGTIRTLNEVSARMLLANALPPPGASGTLS